MPELSVIMATVNDSLACNLTSASIISQLERDDIDYEFIIIDNNSLPVEKEILDAFLKYHKHLFPIQYYNFEVTGTITIHSFGVKKAKGKYIVMPEPHIILTPHYYKNLLKDIKELQPLGFEMIWTPFISGTVARRTDGYCGESSLCKPNPFVRPNSLGIGCDKDEKPRPLLANAFCGMICEREWMLKIGNMFPEAFSEAGGYCAESLMIGILTWMFGKKCYLQTNELLEHPVYRRHKGPGRNEHLDFSMAVAGYILGGKDYVADPKAHMELVLKNKAVEEARQFVKKNAKMTLKEFVDNWEKIRDA